MEFLTKFLTSTQDFSNTLGATINSDITGGLSLFLLFFLLIIFLAALSFGKTRIALALVSTYIAAFLESIFIYRLQLVGYLGDFWKVPAIFWARLSIFIVLFIVAFLILNRSILKPKMSLRESPPLAILFLSVLQGIFWLSIIISYAPLFEDSVFNSYPVIRKYFTWPPFHFIWALAPLLALLFVRRKKVV